MTRISRKKLIELTVKSGRLFHLVGPASECARTAVTRFGGHVMGFQYSLNLSAGVGASHEFAVTEDRLLIDPWLWRFRNYRPVLDLMEQVDFEESVKLYGPEECWGVYSDRLLDRMLV